jgi:peptidoglycan/xylan/chitin deacetylase (PgdA/CDA1 family)
MIPESSANMRRCVAGKPEVRGGHVILLRVSVVSHWPSTNALVVALSFDDGPSEWTGAILDLLRLHEAKATFFVLGEAIAGREDTLRRIADEGHEIGNHSMTHPRLVTCDDRTIRDELERANRLIEATVSVAPTVFRPPRFEYDERVLRVARDVGFRRTALASVAPHDYSTSNPHLIATLVSSSVTPGAIIGLHDGRPANEPDEESLPGREGTVAAVGLMLPRLLERGYRIVTVSELLTTW